MTEVVNETEETPEVTTEVTETVEVPLPEFEEMSLAGMVLGKARTLYNQLTELATKLNAVGNVGELLSVAVKESTDEKVLELRAKIETANQYILDWTKEAEGIVKPTLEIPSDDEVKAQEEAYKALLSQVKMFDGVFITEVKPTYPELDIYAYLGELPKAKRGGSSGAKAGQGEGTSRPRVSEIAVSLDNGETYTKVEKDGKSSFTTLAAWLKKETGEVVGATDFHEAWAEATGIKNWADAPTNSEFGYSVTDAKSKTHQFLVRVTK